MPNWKRMLSHLRELAIAAWKRPHVWYCRRLFERIGRHVHFDPDGFYSFENISVGDDVLLGIRPVLLAGQSKIRIGSKVMFGPQVMIVGGGHNTAEVGRFMYDVHEKRPGDDQGVTIDDDVWVGGRAMILRGVTVGRGAIVGAASVVTRDVPPYAIAVGVPARILRFRWDVDTILRHEAALYPEAQRYTRDALLSMQAGVPTGNNEVTESSCS